ncbi:hypothetical protein J5X84_17170 [Streptosporangiaceae bacterium NEAU-GS5]|nr:hypothetical protein [Streptosporangiaceae bacterium NEAU-GS5]
MSLDELVRAIAPDSGPGMTPGADELMREITALPRTAPRRTRRRTWAALAAALAALVTWMLPLTGPAAAALDIERDGDFYVVTVRNLFAEPQVYMRQLRAIGLHVQLEVAPASPRRVGTILQVDRETHNVITAVQEPGACARDLLIKCAIAVRIPVTYAGRTMLILGRAARPGESYLFPGAVVGPGELLGCTPIRGETVRTVRALVEGRGAQVSRVINIRARGAAVPDDWYVDSAILVADHKVLVGAVPEPLPKGSDFPNGC